MASEKSEVGREAAGRPVRCGGVSVAAVGRGGLGFAAVVYKVDMTYIHVQHFLFFSFYIIICIYMYMYMYEYVYIYMCSCLHI